MLTLSDIEEEVLRRLFSRLASPGLIALPQAAPVPTPAAAETFEQVARRWHAHKAKQRWTERHAKEVIDTLERDIFPAIGARPINTITPPEALEPLRAIEARGAVETALRVRQRISAVFAFAIAEGIATYDPAAVVGKALSPAPPKIHHPALTEIDDCRDLLAAMEYVDASASLKLASRFLALTTVRAACVRSATWAEIEGLDGPDPMWRVPAAHMKMATAKKKDAANAHLIPLSRQAVTVLRAAAAPRANGSALIFPNIGESALGSMCKRAGYAGRHVPHGWRASFSTIMNERYPDDRAIIDMALAHSPKDKVEAAYNRAAHIGRRRDVLQRWADLLDPPGSASKPSTTPGEQ